MKEQNESVRATDQLLMQILEEQRKTNQLLLMLIEAMGEEGGDEGQEPQAYLDGSPL